MNREKELQLALWREACRHIDIAESAGDLLRTVSRFVPVDGIWIFGHDGKACEFLAAAGRAVAPNNVSFSLSREESQGVARWMNRGGLALLNPIRPGRSLLRPLAAAFAGHRTVICGALIRNEQPEGLVVWTLKDDAELDAANSLLIAATLEPLAVALDTSRRFHELEALRRAAEADRQAALNRLGRQSLDEKIVGAHNGLQGVMERVVIVAASSVPVLILGETGSGKEVIARAIHERSTRSKGPFLRVNCGAIPPDLIDSQLFGHEKGAFTGATERRHGWFERADDGTLFLDEIGELSLAAQVRLLRVMQEGILERVGGQDSVRVDVRIIAATHRNLAEMVQTREFREDLWYRLAVFPLVIPPLRERRQDLQELAQHFADRASIHFGLQRFEITGEDASLLAQYDWPGNIRELAAVIDRAALLGGGRRLAIEIAMGPPSRLHPRKSDGRHGETCTASMSLEDAIRDHIEHALKQTRGRIEGVGGAAELLDINPHTLRSKMKKLDIDWRKFRQLEMPPRLL